MSLVIGGYATSPPDASPDALTSYYAALLSIGFEKQSGGKHAVGLEIPLHANGLLAQSPEQEAALLRAISMFPGCRSVLTLVPGTMAQLSTMPAFGLASSDERGRNAALAFARLACAGVERITDAGGSIVGVEVHSAPRRAYGLNASGAALTASLVEMASWDWKGAEIVVEHCDDANGPDPVKGFLPFAEELEAVRDARAAVAGVRVGVTINWARSVLETRDSATPLEQIMSAGTLLRGFIFSGCTGSVTPYGSPWQDIHCPWADVETTSMLTRKHIASIANKIAASGAMLLFAGVKVALQPACDFDSASRVAVNKEMLAAVANALSEHVFVTGSN